jgi:hypothetical protein
VARSLIGMMILLAALAGCGVLSEAQQTGSEVATSAAALQQTAEVLAPTLQAGAGALQQTAQALAPTLEAQAPGLAQTLEALAPTLEAQAPGLVQTLEALATAQPGGGAAAQQTVRSITGGAGAPTDIPLPDSRRVLLSSPDKLIYTTDEAYGSLTELYLVEMPRLGWREQEGSVTTESAAVLRFSKGQRTATVTIAKMAEGATVDVTIEGA